MKEFLTIKEFSKLSGITSKTLRYWDDIGLFRPAKRDPLNNYRYYMPQQITAVNFVNVMSMLNMPLKTIGEIRDARCPESIVKLIEKQEHALDVEMRQLRERYAVIHARRELINYGMRIDEHAVSVEYREDKWLILGPRNEFKEGEGFYEAFVRFCDQAEQLRINLNYPIGGYHESMESFLAQPGKPDFFFSLDPTGNATRAAGDYLVAFTRGYYGEFGSLPERMDSYRKEHSVKVSGPVYSRHTCKQSSTCYCKEPQVMWQFGQSVAVLAAGLQRFVCNDGKVGGC
jgi:DNA-binding transcriptional MerR regulator